MCEIGHIVRLIVQQISVKDMIFGYLWTQVFKCIKSCSQHGDCLLLILLRVRFSMRKRLLSGILITNWLILLPTPHCLLLFVGGVGIVVVRDYDGSTAVNLLPAPICCVPGNVEGDLKDKLST